MADKMKHVDSVLESLYELWIEEDPAYDENVRQLFGKLGEWATGWAGRTATG